MRLNVECQDDVLEEFRQRADVLGRSVSDVIRELVVGWVRSERRAEADRLLLDERRKQRWRDTDD
jgi:predicted CopG family antitoxin